MKSQHMLGVFVCFIGIDTDFVFWMVEITKACTTLIILQNRI